ncbi:glycoside hydrolase family 28 protein [Undibacterium fentianense]|uniref:Glycoside hydrolase family 28 protein n=1 Tax=Undibacterium fentianense TaxID=2828728 RepID=A0A941E001_9BURK|nr:glycoside hydrolase family 28 protein [Undibacterium fentianense]MBR7799865.1 glycoside hydrolase family 28 protein [Undibacterium fentianense]
MLNASSPLNRQRRALLRYASATSLFGIPISTRADSEANSPISTQEAWQRAEKIIAQFSKPLRFPKRDFDITQFGAKSCATHSVAAHISSDTEGAINGIVAAPELGAFDCYAAIRNAIDACHQAGGGRVIIPSGDWYCAGPIRLRSNVHLHLQTKAHVFFSANPADYAKYGDIDCGKNGKLVISRWQGNDCLNYSSMIYAYAETNIALTGEDRTSILDGQGGTPFEDGSGLNWWSWKGKKSLSKPNPYSEVQVNPNNPTTLDQWAPSLSPEEKLFIQGPGDKWRTDARFLPALSELGIPTSSRIFGIGHYLRPCMIEFIACTNVELRGYKIQASPFWLHHPVKCTHLHIQQVNMDSMGPNSDGFDPESCDTVLIDRCSFNTGDDCIAIKSGKNRDTQMGPSRHIVIQRCTMNSGHGAVTLGSEMAAGIEHVYAQDLDFNNIHWQSDPLNTAIRMKTNMNRGGYLRHFYVRNIRIPNGVKTTPAFYKPLPGSQIPLQSVPSTAGAIITIDCDYAPADDSVRTRPPMISDIHIEHVQVGNVDTEQGAFSCYQAFVLLGPVASSFNGKPGSTILPIQRVSIRHCDFGKVRNNNAIWYSHNVQDLQLENVRINGKSYTQKISSQE